MMDKVLRLPKESALAPIALRLLSPIHPTAITIAAFGVGLAAGVAAWQQAYILGLGLWLLNRMLDGLDGTVARMHNKQSDVGGYLDIMLDMATYAIIPVALALGLHSIPVYVSLGILLGAFYVNSGSWMYLAALLEKRKQGAAAQSEMTTVTMPPGLIEGTETIIFYCLFFLLPIAIVPLFSAMAVLVLVTAMQRLVWAIRHL